MKPSTYVQIQDVSVKIFYIFKKMCKEILQRPLLAEAV